ncbi:hypothetical protein OUZ56_018734 [Daphnia magna]|uniref:Uncharacterized protein n=1 Tax=Daphnia magna TaxID=35525 RepID=A0ABQ9Z9R4_9CRUS|nr:hypothetical protein OUZ56_018734 [Daphnia magna]
MSRKLKGKTYFKDEWITDEENPEWASWLRRYPSDNTVAELKSQLTVTAFIRKDVPQPAVLNSNVRDLRQSEMVAELPSLETNAFSYDVQSNLGNSKTSTSTSNIYLGQGHGG